MYVGGISSNQPPLDSVTSTTFMTLTPRLVSRLIAHPVQHFSILLFHFQDVSILRTLFNIAPVRFESSPLSTSGLRMQLRRGAHGHTTVHFDTLNTVSLHVVHHLDPISLLHAAAPLVNIIDCFHLLFIYSVLGLKIAFPHAPTHFLI
jgi:hypothetical protein